MEVWFEHYAKVKVRPSSHQTYRGYIDNHIKPNIGKIQLEKLTSLELQKFYKKLLEKGVAPVDAAVTTGFSDQSHFSNFFKEFIGLTPKQYQRIFEEDAEADRKGPGEAMEDRMDGEAEHE